MSTETEDRKYFDAEGNPRTLREMLWRDPEWLLSRFRFMERELAKKEAPPVPPVPEDNFPYDQGRKG